MRSALLFAAALAVPGAGASELVPFEPQEIRRIVGHGPWPQPVLPVTMPCIGIRETKAVTEAMRQAARSMPRES